MSDPSEPADGTPHIIGATTDELPSDLLDVSHVIAYDLRPEERPGGPDGLKVRFVVSVATGQRARVLDAKQAAAIKELLEWARDHRSESEKGQENAHGSTGKDQ
ncbi:MAG TPA: hypothetical protein VGI96_18030 [Streptosporangiaceae bacterium]|jgi:hypothetical protein